MNLRKTLILGVLLAIGALFIFRYEIPRTEEEKTKELLFPRISKGEFSEIFIVRGQEKIPLRNLAPAKSEDVESGADEEEFHEEEMIDASGATEDSPGQWELGDLAGAGIDTGKMGALLSALVNLKSENVIPKAELETDLGIYGLSSPELSIEVRAGDKTVTIDLGKENKFTSQRYARVRGREEVFMIGRALYDATKATRSELRDKAPIKFKEKEVAGITLTSGSNTIVIGRGGKNEWRITAPVEATGSRRAIPDLLMQLGNVRAEEFVDQGTTDLKRFALDKPKLKVEVSFTGESHPKLEIIFGNVGDKYYFKVSGQPSLFRSAVDVAAKLNKPLNEYREGNLFQFDPQFVNHVTYDGALSGAVSLNRAAQEWTLDGKPAEGAFVSQLLRDLADLKASDFPASSTEDPGFGTPQMRVVVRGDVKDSPERVLVIGKALKGGGAFAGVDDLKEPFIVSSDALKKILPKREVLLKSEAPPTASPSPTQIPPGSE